MSIGKFTFTAIHAEVSNNIDKAYVLNQENTHSITPHPRSNILNKLILL